MTRRTRISWQWESLGGGWSEVSPNQQRDERREKSQLLSVYQVLDSVSYFTLARTGGETPPNIGQPFLPTPHLPSYKQLRIDPNKQTIHRAPPSPPPRRSWSGIKQASSLPGWLVNSIRQALMDACCSWHIQENTNIESSLLIDSINSYLLYAAAAGEGTREGRT